MSFLCFRLEWVVAAYSLMFGAACFLCLARICATGRTVGGWAWMASVPVDVNMMAPVEGVAYFLGVISCLVGFVGMAFRHMTSDTGPAEVARVAKRTAGAMLIFFLASVLRLSMFIPITVMVLVEGDVCGVYAWGITSTSLSGQRTTSSLFNCRQVDVSKMLSVVVWGLLDIFMVRLVCLFWQDCRRRQSDQACQVKSILPESFGSGRHAEYAITLDADHSRTCEVRL